MAALPWYKIDAIEEQYGRCVYRMFWIVVGFIAGTVGLSATFLGDDLYPWLIGTLIVGCVFIMALEIQTWWLLGNRRLEANVAEECNPDPHKETNQPADWFGLLKAGFEARRPKPMTDERWKLTGKPGRILDKGSFSIPVHRVQNTEGRLSPQHIVRIMAHCHLIEISEGAVCPYGIVLFGNTYKGTTVPNTNANRERFHTALERVRKMIVDSKNGERQPAEPADTSICAGCIHGEPRPANDRTETMRYDKPLPPWLLKNRKGKLFHCNCGDRFHWKPAHKRNSRLRRAE